MLPDDENYIMRLYKAYYRPMYSQIKKIVGDDEIVRELIQDTMLRLIKKVATLKTLSERQLTTYVSKTSKSVALNYMSRKRVREKWTYYGAEVDFAGLLPDKSETPESIYERRVSYDELAQAISRLSERDQDLLYFYYILEIDSKELSRIMGIPKRNLRQYIYMARKRAYRLLMEGGSQHHG